MKQHILLTEGMIWSDVRCDTLTTPPWNCSVQNSALEKTHLDHQPADINAPTTDYMVCNWHTRYHVFTTKYCRPMDCRQKLPTYNDTYTSMWHKCEEKEQHL